MKQTFKDYLAALWKSVLFILLFGAAIAAMIIPYESSMIDKQLPPAISRLILDTISFLPTLLASWIMLRFIDKSTLKSIGLSSKHLPINIIIGVLIAFCWISLSICGQFLFHTLSKNKETHTLTSAMGIYAIAWFLNAASQELLFRGYLFYVIRKYVGLYSAMIITSILFMCAHGGALNAGIIPSINVFGAGLLFAVAFYKTGNLWTPIFIHFIWNFVIDALLFTPIDGYEGLRLLHLNGSKLLAGGQNGIEATIITSIVIVLVIAAVLFFIKKTTSTKE